MSKKIIKIKQSDLVKQVRKIISEQNETQYNVDEIYEKYFYSSCESDELNSFEDPFAYGDALIDHIYDLALSDGLVTEEKEDDFKNDFKDKYGEEVLDSFKGDFEEEVEMNEEGEEDSRNIKTLKLAVDDNGKYYIIDPDNGNLVGMTK